MADFSKCWDCAKAIGQCSWSTEFKPVEGWIAEQTKPTSTKPYITYHVIECPEFKRDAVLGGVKRFKE